MTERKRGRAGRDKGKERGGGSRMGGFVLGW